MHHPYETLSLIILKRAFWLALAGAIFWMVMLSWVGLPLNTSAAPVGIVSFELAGSPEHAAQILASWDADAHLHAAFSLGLDFIFMPFYAAAISLACAWASGVLAARRLPLAGFAAALSWGLWIAALFDMGENVALTSLLFGALHPALPVIAQVCAAVKFALVFAGMIVGFVGLIASRTSRPVVTTT